MTLFKYREITYLNRKCQVYYFNYGIGTGTFFSSGSGSRVKKIQSNSTELQNWTELELYTNLIIKTKPIGKTVKLDKIYSNSCYFFNGSNIEKLQWHFEVQSNSYAVYSRPVENIANCFVVCELKNFFIEKCV